MVITRDIFGYLVPLYVNKKPWLSPLLEWSRVERVPVSWDSGAQGAATTASTQPWRGDAREDPTRSAAGESAS